MKDIKELVESYKTEDGVNWEEANKAYNEHINNIVSSKVSKEVEKAKESAQQEITKSFINDLGIEAEDVDGVKVWAKKMMGNTDEFKEQNIQLEKQLKEAQAKAKEFENNYKQVNNEYTTTKQIQKIIGKGYDPEQAEYLQFKLSKQVNEEQSFDDLLESITEPEETKPKSTNRFVKTPKGSHTDISDSIKKRYPNYFGNK